jgi:dTDP-4-dehydrorhamnose reductase
MLAAENACKAGNIKFTIFRINNMFGYSSSNKPDTVAEIVEMLSEKQDCPLPVDVFVNPVYTEDTAIAVLKIIEKKRTGIYNLGSPERLSLFEFARRIADVFNLDSNYIKGKKAAEIYKNVKIATNCGLINLKAETDLGIKFAKIINSLTAYKFRLGLVN